MLRMDTEEFIMDKQDFINRWHLCKLPTDSPQYQHCYECKRFKHCYEEAKDAHLGNQLFEEVILNSGYDSMDAFWESNGI